MQDFLRVVQLNFTRRKKGVQGGPVLDPKGGGALGLSGPHLGCVDHVYHFKSTCKNIPPPDHHVTMNMPVNSSSNCLTCSFIRGQRIASIKSAPMGVPR